MRLSAGHNLAECSIEKVAISAVMAGCRPEYMPVVLAVVEAALKPEFSRCMGCDTWLCRTRGDCERSHHETHPG